MIDKISSILEGAVASKKEQLELFVWDLASILLTSFVIGGVFSFISYILKIYYHLTNIKQINFCGFAFIILWFILAIVTAIVFHVKLNTEINKNTKRMISEDEQ